MRSTLFASALLAASLPAAAFAQDPSARPPMPPPPPPAAPVNVAPPAPPLEEGVDLAQLEDPNIDRSFLLPTAQTQPKGTLSFNDYELLILGLTYGVTNDLQVSVQGLAPIVEDMPILVMGAAKLRVLKRGPLRLAVQAGLTHLGENGDDDHDDGYDDDERFTLGHVGLLASACLSDDCHSMASASAQFVQPLSSAGNDDGTAVIYSASLLARITPHTKLMLEVASAGVLSDHGENENIDGVLVNYGVRFFTRHIAADLGFLKPFAEGGDDDLVLGVPFVNFTYRH